MSTVRGSLAAAVLDDKVYAIGGGRPGISLDTTEIYDPTLNTFMAGGAPDLVKGNLQHSLLLS
jgi:Kelch motif